MAIDYLIGTLIAVSAVVNALALGAFWVTPGLRTTANRFVINLLIVNLVGCAALTPSLFGSSSSSSSSNSMDDSYNHIGIGGPVFPAQLPQQLRTVNATTSSTSNKTSSLVDLALAEVLAVESAAMELVSEANAVDDSVVKAMEVVASIAVETESAIASTNGDEDDDDTADNGDISDENLAVPGHRESATFWGNTRHWGFDLTAALGALSVLLIVGDTWCAVTDPLRYHARISGPKAWIAIAASWGLSLLCGIASAFRTDQFRYGGGAAILSVGRLYDMCFAGVYFALIILAPIGLVCGMYWKIVTEAKQNGLRMRQNGSSPLLQSALNLAAASAQVQPAAATTTLTTTSAATTAAAAALRPVPSTGGLIMNIDQQQQQQPHHGDANDSDAELDVERGDANVRPLLSAAPLVPPPTTRQYLEIPHQLGGGDKNHNSLLPPAMGGNLTRNLSTRYLLLPTAAGDQKASNGGQQRELDAASMRTVRSTPNLQKSADHAVAMHTLHHHQHHMQHHHNHSHHHASQHQHQHCVHHQHHHHHVPCKALCYMSSIRHRLSNASSIFKYREESRAARISVLVVVMFVLSYLPYGLLVLLDGAHAMRSWWPERNEQLCAVLCVMVSNVGSPFIFAYRNKRVRRGVWRLFGLDAKTNERLQKRQLSTTTQLRPASMPARLSTGDRVPPLAAGAAGVSASLSGATAAPTAPQQTVVPRLPSVTVSITREDADDDVAIEPVLLRASQSIIRQKLTLLKRAYQSTRKLSCTGSACGSESGSSNGSGNSSSSSSSSSTTSSSTSTCTNVSGARHSSGAIQLALSAGRRESSSADV